MHGRTCSSFASLRPGAEAAGCYGLIWKHRQLARDGAPVRSRSASPLLGLCIPWFWVKWLLPRVNVNVREYMCAQVPVALDPDSESFLSSGGSGSGISRPIVSLSHDTWIREKGVAMSLERVNGRKS